MARPSKRSARSIAATAVAASWLLFIIGSGGCEVAVGDTVPAFACLPNEGDTCPAGQMCDSTNRCVPCPASGCGPTVAGDSGMADEVTVNDTGTAPDTSMSDASPPPDTSTPADTSTPVDSGPCPGAVGCSCSGASACSSGICADSLTVTTGLYDAAGMNNFCTQPCCTSQDCPAGTVCFATGQGGDYCVNPTWIGRTDGTGSGGGGDTCGTGRDCRSGLCLSSKCVDTCCSSASATECSGGETCQFSDFPGLTSVDKNYSAFCATSPGSHPAGDNCSGNSSCQSDLCAVVGGGSFQTCIGACRSGSDCGAGSSCSYLLTNQPENPTPIVAACFAGQGSLPEGSACSTMNDNCQGFCDPTSSLCTDVCFTTTDCTKSGWTCRPETIAVSGGGSYSVLCCGS